MAVSTTYTEVELKEYMHTVLGEVATVLDFSTATSYDESFNEVMYAFDEADVGNVSGIDDMRKLRALARREAWRTAMSEVTPRYDFESVGQTLKRNQFYDNVRRNFQQAIADCLNYDENWKARTHTLTYSDPYQPLELDE